MDNLPALVNALRELNFPIASKNSFEDLRSSVVNYINGLIIGDFEKLVNILYRIDVSESKLKSLLKEANGKNASNIITDLIIERQLQKINRDQNFQDYQDC
jgi:hypothetical protein